MSGPDSAPDGWPLGSVPPTSTDDDSGGRRHTWYGHRSDTNVPRHQDRSACRRPLQANDKPWWFHPCAQVGQWFTPSAHHNICKTHREKSILAFGRIVVEKRVGAVLLEIVE